jgi:hypothetical protein
MINPLQGHSLESQSFKEIPYKDIHLIDILIRNSKQC